MFKKTTYFSPDAGYTRTMYKIVANYPTTRAGWRKHASWLLAGTILLTTLYSLFTFDDFSYILKRAWPNMSADVGLLVATTIAIAGVFSLPYLLEMKLSPLMRICSAACAVVFVSLWVLFFCSLFLS